MRPHEIQERQYKIPYHHLPWIEEGIWGIGRSLAWGYEYLALLHTIMDIIDRRIASRLGEFNLLDFGCGDGRLIVEVLSRYEGVREVWGVDISDRALAFARAFTWGDDRVHFCHDIKEVMDSGCSFHVVVASEVFEHIPPNELPSIVKQIHSLLNDNGLLIVTVPTTNIPVNPKHYQHFTVDKLEALTIGLYRVEAVQYVHKLGMIAEVVRRCVINRAIVANSKWWLALCTLLYKKFVMRADPRTAAHIVATMRKVVRQCELSS